MKSLLVDVLRQAQDAAPEEAPATSPDDEATESIESNEAATARTPAIDDLDLMATGQYDVTKDLDEDVAENEDEDLPPAPAEQPMVEPAPATPPALESRPDATPEHKTDLLLQAPLPLIIRFGRMTPLLCLLAVVGVAGTYLVLDRLTSGSLNEDLDDISQIVQVGAAAGTSERQQGLSSILGMPQEPRVSSRDAGPAVPDAGTTNFSATVKAPAAPERSAAVAPINVQRAAANGATVADSAFELVAGAYAAYQQGDFDAAQRLYTQALSVEPNHRDALLGIAAVYQQTERPAAALATYNKVLQVDPANTVAAAAILSSPGSGLQPNSESDIKLLLQRYPDAHHFHFALGSVYVGEHRWAEARHAFQAAWQLAPANANYSYNLAVSSERLGDLVEAAHYYEQALIHATENSNVDRSAIEDHLDQLAIIARDDR